MTFFRLNDPVWYLADQIAPSIFIEGHHVPGCTSRHTSEGGMPIELPENTLSMLRLEGVGSS